MDHPCVCVSECDSAGGGCEDQGHVFSQEKDSRHRGVFGGERRRQVATDL